MNNCKHCKSPNLVYLPRTFANGTVHVECVCGDCKRHQGFVKSVMDEDFVLPFGKYKGQKLADVFRRDRKYVDWLFETGSSALKNRIENLAAKAGGVT